MANELKHGTLINLLTKGVQRVTIILAKFVSASALWTLTYAICICVNAGYTAYYFETVSMEHALLSFAALWLFGEFLIAVAIFAGTLFKSFIGALLTSLLLAFTMSILTINPDFDRYNPITLCAKNMQLLQGFSSADDVTVVIVCMCITAGAVIVMIAGAIAVFSKQQV
ncbi:hypothetical protein FACS1894105_14360 [Clostridia bacterium]|nr:hypothetical protein FACS1894105_14360 [Clostridia bacterium]